jgi:hypothetical protein
MPSACGAKVGRVGGTVLLTRQVFWLICSRRVCLGNSWFEFRQRRWKEFRCP